VNRVDQVENRVSGTGNKVEELDQTVKTTWKMLRKYEWYMQDIWDTTKRQNLWIIGIEEGEEIQTNAIDNLFNKIINENFPNLRKRGSFRYRKLIEH
jgi:hypothetical protein